MQTPFSSHQTWRTLMLSCRCLWRHCCCLRHAGKIVFMAPTKPLVAQQVTACYGIMGIPEECTAELQGSIPPARRQLLWQQRRVFYCTPQSLANDIKTGACNPGWAETEVLSIPTVLI